MLSKEQKKERDLKILTTVDAFVNSSCRLSDEDIGKMVNIPSSSVGRYLTCDRTRELIGPDNYAFIKKARKINKDLGRQKGGSHRKNG